MIKTRPFFITLVCLGLIVSGCYFLFTSFSDLKKPEIQDAMDHLDQNGLPYALQVTMLYLNAIISIVCGVWMFEEKNWARWVYLGWGFVYIDYLLYAYFFSDWSQCVPWIAAYLVSSLILLVPSGNRYFSTGFSADDLL